MRSRTTIADMGHNAGDELSREAIRDVKIPASSAPARPQRGSTRNQKGWSHLLDDDNEEGLIGEDEDFDWDVSTVNSFKK